MVRISYYDISQHFKLLTFPFLICLTICGFTFSVNAQTSNVSYPVIDFEKIEEEKSTINFSLNEIVTIIEESIKTHNKVIIPEGVTEFERALFEARKIQHNDHQLEAIKHFKTLLEFKCYRTRGEELYIRLLLGTSLSYLKAPLIAHNYIKNVFPDICTEIENPEINGFLINHYAGLLVKIDSLELAAKVYLENRNRYRSIGNERKTFETNNNLGFVYSKLGKLAEAKSIFAENQKADYKNMNAVIYAFSFGNYGSVLLKEKKYDSALYYLRKEIMILNELNSSEGLYNTVLNIGEALEGLGHLDSARLYYNKSLKISNSENILKGKINAYEKLIELHATEEKSDELSMFLSQYLLHTDSLTQVAEIKAAKEELLLSQLLTIFKETENSKERYDELENRTNTLIYAVFILVFLVFLMVLILSFYFNNRNSLKKINGELKTKNDELNNSYQLISDSNEKNQLLLKELHHRVKNNLQIISSLFNLQLNASNMDYETEKVFKDAKNRIYSISLVHKKIYQSDNIDSLDFEEYLRDFSDELLNATPNDVNLSIEIQRNPISIDVAIPLGLIFNELFTNSIKHAKPHDSLQITVNHSEENGREKFIYTDNGVGVQNIEVMTESGSSIGTTLINLLGKQLEATIEYKEASEGEHGFWLSIERDLD